jgi:hypothetical protein
MSKTTSCKENQHSFVQAGQSAGKEDVLLYCQKCGQIKRIK